MKKQPRYSPEVIERAVHMVSEAGSQYESQWAAITSIAAKIITYHDKELAKAQLPRVIGGRKPQQGF
jgi:hypothetical protein